MTTQPANPSLPNDLLLSCIARVTRLYYPTLSLVSKGFRDLLASLELYQTRSLLGHTESCLYVSFLNDPNPRLYTLCQVPNRMNKKNSSGKILVPVPIPIPSSPNSPPRSNHLVAVGSNIYNIGGDVPSSSRVSVLDCKSHTGHQAPSMRVARSSSSTISLLDGEIYVAGGCEDRNSLNWVESFDPKNQTWSSVTSPSAEIRNGGLVKLKSLGLEGKLFLFGDKYDEVFNPKDGNWYPIEFNSYGICAAPYYGNCVIDNVLFSLFYGFFNWYDYKDKLWKVLYGLEVLLEKLWKRFHALNYDCRNYEFGRCKMVDYGGKMVVLWEEECDGSQENMIWCAEIELKRRNRDEIWGKIKWFDVVLTIPKSCNWLNVNAFSTTV